MSRAIKLNYFLVNTSDFAFENKMKNELIS